MTSVSSEKGLTQSEVTQARQEHGWNEIPEAQSVGPVAVFVRQFTSLLVIILIVAAIAALALGETIDAITIGLVVLLNAILGFIQEWKAAGKTVILGFGGPTMGGRWNEPPTCWEACFRRGADAVVDQLVPWFLSKLTQTNSLINFPLPSIGKAEDKKNHYRILAVCALGV